MDGHTNWLKCPPKDPNRMLRTADIWQYPRKYLNKPHYNLDVSDIEGAQPRPEKSNLGARKVNPLNPEYSWSTTKLIEPPTTKFLRNTLNIDDIWGAKPARTGPYSIKQRDSMNFKDIDKSYAGWNKNHHKRRNYTKYDPLNVKDINHDFIGINRFQTRGNRCTNPLQPEYEYNRSRKSGLLSSILQQSQSQNILGFVKGSRPSKLNRFINKDEFNLRTSDIKGARSNHGKWKRNKPKDPNYIGDIENTKPNTTISFKTRRCTNPLDPKYKFLDYKPPQQNNNTALSLKRNKSTPALSKSKSKANAQTTENPLIESKNRNRNRNGKKLNNSKSSAILAPVITINSNNNHNPKLQGSSSGLTKINTMNKYEKEQHSQQIQDDIDSVRSLTSDDC